MSDGVTAGALLAALRTKHRQDAVVREVVIDDPLEKGHRFRDRIDRYQRDGWGLLVEREYANAMAAGVQIPDTLPDGWSLRDSTPRRRIDALIFASTGITAVEIKVTRADFKRDTDDKRRAWRAVTNRFVYLTPKGLVSPEEVADGCGLWEYDADKTGPYPYQHGIASVKRAVANREPAQLPFQVTRALAYRVSRYEEAA